MSDAILIALIAGVAPTLAAIAGAAVNWFATARVHTIVNSQRTEMVATIDSLRGELAELRTRIHDLTPGK